jgi:hypothetical protein
MTEVDYDPDFKEMPMWDQLGKIMDSEGNPIERNWVKTDDGDVIEGVTTKEAAVMLETISNVHSSLRLDVLKYVQTTQGFNEALNHVRNL